MKKVLGIIAVTAMVASSAFAQGTLVFASSASLVRNETGAAIAAGGGQVQFAWAALGTAYTPWTPALSASGWLAANPGWTVIGTPTGLGTPLAGRFSGGTLSALTTTPGAIIQGVVIGWTGTGANDFLAGYAGALAQGAAGQFGINATPFTVQTGNPLAVPPGTPGNIYNSTATPFTGLTLSTIPEPTSFALAGLGAAALLIFRRRK